MNTRKKMKELGRRSLKKHYTVFVAACLIAAFLGAEFKSSLDFASAQKREETAQEFERNLEGDFSPQVKTEVSGVSWEDVLMTIAENNTQAGREMTQEIEEEEIRDAADGNPIFGRTRGVLSGVVNDLSSGSILVTLVAAGASITGSESLAIILLILLGALGAFAFWFFVVNVFPVVTRRIFLEGLVYDRVTAQRFTFLLRIRKWTRASWIMFVKYVFYSLWSLTVVGAVIKRYSYYLVPYIAAENPDMKARDAITLSRRMMNGHKWECFVFELTFVGWQILGILTMGLFNIFYTNPYKTASFTQYYAQLRAAALAENLPGSELLHDTCLYEKADGALLEETYRDVIQVMDAPEAKPEKLAGWRGFLANNFGLLLMRRREDRAYERHLAEYVRIQEMVDDARGEAYPVRLYPIAEEERRKLVQSLNYMRHYSVWSLLAIFLGMSFFGWLWEVGMHLVTNGEFVNRGALHGPWLPIYGTGAVLILLILNRLRRNPALLFLATVLLCGCLEYTTSLVMEIATGGTKWWDYSGYYLNLNGRICAEGLLVFGIGGLAITYVLAPIIDNLLARVNEKRVMAVCSVLMIAFAADAVYSQFHPNAGKGVTDIAQDACLPDAGSPAVHPESARHIPAQM
ncbi:DUF975 family protein [Mordavella massiliensis]|uniref:DUF975 family protein n=1 Tax=Mordavella massiliensis TaxID=1871024 RepID=A0A939BGY2_9CLOT|nr:DUF975 family protein [Mordavella massiliensis]MBM6948221.1 DUF975 family protein [Mordavella massiliensis]